MINTLLLKLAAFSYRAILAIGFAVGLLYFFLMFDSGAKVTDQLNKVNSEITGEEALMAESEKAFREIEEIRKTVGALNDQFKLTSAQLPTEVQMSEVIRAIDSVASATRISVKDKAPQPTVQTGVVEATPLRLNLEGTYSDLTLFLFQLAKQERIMKVRNFSIALRPGVASGTSTTDNRLSFDGQINSYRFVGEKKK